jgi:hypothetical protein
VADSRSSEFRTDSIWLDGPFDGNAVMSLSGIVPYLERLPVARRSLTAPAEDPGAGYRSGRVLRPRTTYGLGSLQGLTSVS